jgi:hypothetical protein
MAIQGSKVGTKRKIFKNPLDINDRLQNFDYDTRIDRDLISPSPSPTLNNNDIPINKDKISVYI